MNAAQLPLNPVNHAPTASPRAWRSRLLGIGLASCAFLGLGAWFALGQRQHTLPEVELPGLPLLAVPSPVEPRAARPEITAEEKLRLEEKDIEPARELSLREPLNFARRRERYLAYLECHPHGALVQEAATALKAIAEDWDKFDFRAVRDHYLAKPGDATEIAIRGRAYLAAHPDGRFAAAARDLLRWSECVTAPGEYRVTLRRGSLDRSLARFFSRGPDLSVELEVNGARHGPSPILKNCYNPEWEYEFPRRVRWKLGEPIRIRVTDHDWRDRVVMDIASAEGDPLAMRLLSGEVWSAKSWLTFASDFVMPKMPKVE